MNFQTCKHFVKKKSEVLFSISLSVIVSFFFLLKSPLHPWISAETGTDSSVFKTISLAMERGLMPYKDSFDHKGPLLYILNYLGNKISDYKGIWLLEFIFLTITLVMIYKIARLSCKIFSSIIITFISISLLFNYFEGGNLTEEYAMPFIAISLFIFLDFFLTNMISCMRLIICGLCLGGTLLLRPNMISLWIVMCFSIFIKEFLQKNWNTLVRYIFFFSIGLLLIVLPIIFWLAINGSLSQCWNDYILFNMNYTADAGSRSLFTAKWTSFFTFFNSTAFIIAFFTVLISIKNKSLHTNITYLTYMLITLLFICMSGMTYSHYGMILIPLMSYPFSIIFSKLENIIDNNLSATLIMIVSIYFLSTQIVPCWVDLIQTVPATYIDRSNTHFTDTSLSVANYITNNTTESDKISVYGNWDFIYILSNRTHATKYSYQFPIGEITPYIFTDYFKQLKQELPHIIVIQQGHLDNHISEFLSTNNYALAWSEYNDSTEGALIYSHK